MEYLISHKYCYIKRKCLLIILFFITTLIIIGESACTKKDKEDIQENDSISNDNTNNDNTTNVDISFIDVEDTLNMIVGEEKTIVARIKATNNFLNTSLDNDFIITNLDTTIVRVKNRKYYYVSDSVLDISIIITILKHGTVTLILSFPKYTKDTDSIIIIIAPELSYDIVSNFPIYDSIVINLETMIPKAKLNPDGHFIIRETETKEEANCFSPLSTNTGCKYYGNNPILYLQDNTLTIKPYITKDAINNFEKFAGIEPSLSDLYDSYGHITTLLRTQGWNLKFNTQYEIYSNKGLIDEETNSYVNGIIHKFTTEELQPTDFFVTYKEQTTYKGTTGEMNFEGTMSSTHMGAIDDGENIHNLSGAINRNLTGKGTNIMIYEPIPIISASTDVYDAVVYSVSPNYKYFDVRLKPIEALPSRKDETIYYNHATQMARYMLNYAPGVNIFDFGGNGPPANHATDIFIEAKNQIDIDDNLFKNGYLTYAEIFIIAKQKKIDIISHSGGISLNKENGILDAISNFIANGGILSIATGNESNVKNDLSISNINNRCEWKQKFLPYQIDMTNKTGAIVLVNAVITNNNSIDNNSIQFLRSGAGDLRYFTLTVVETGVGATSQATATFSAIVALMIEANKKYNAGFTNRQLVELLFETAIDIGDPGVDEKSGYGLIDIETALDRVEKGIAPTFSLYSNLPNLNVNWDDEGICLGN